MARAVAFAQLVLVATAAELNATEAFCLEGSCHEDGISLFSRSRAKVVRESQHSGSLLQVERSTPLSRRSLFQATAETVLANASVAASNPVFFAGFAAAASLLGALLIYRLDHVKVAVTLSGSVSSDRWWLILMSCMVEVVSGSLYAMGAWQDELRDALGISMKSVTLIGAVTFMGSIAAPGGGIIYDSLGPRCAVVLGSSLTAVGYCLMGLAVAAGPSLPAGVKIGLAAAGSLAAGYSGVSLLDNIVCMACSESFPHNRAAVVGYLKAVLATAAGLWALLWVHIFKKPNGPGLPAYLALMAVASFGLCLLALPGVKVLPHGLPRRRMDFYDLGRLSTLVAMLGILAVYDVFASYFFSAGTLLPTPMLGYVGTFLQVVPLVILLTTPSRSTPEEEEELQEEKSSPKLEVKGLPFRLAVRGLDFWLLWLLQFAVFGAGVATNQNLALILESAGNASASGLGVALFALTSSLSRVVVGVLSDKYNAHFDRFNWLTAAAANAALGQLLVSLMSVGGIMIGTLLMGLSFGAFFTVIVPVVNEMYGGLEFGKIFGTQLASQALSSFLICFQLLPAFYRRAAGASGSCEGAECFRTSFLLLTGLNVIGLVAALALQVRNHSSMPLARLGEE